MLLFNCLLRSVRVGSSIRWSSSWLNEKREGQSVLIHVPEELIKEWLDSGVLGSVDLVGVYATLAFVAVDVYARCTMGLSVRMTGSPATTKLESCLVLADRLR